MQRETPDPDATETRTQVDRPPRRERRSPGTLLGRYVLLEELGRGGMSLVYVAYDPELDRRVALKVVRGEQLTEAHSARLHREAQALARLSHPNVVTVFDVGDVSGDTFVAMELLEGVSLRKWLLEARTWRDIVRVMVAAGRGLAAAHAAGILHRDIKPDNIVITATGAVKLVDFGLARDLGDRSASGSGSGGTPTPGDHDLDLDAPISTSESVTLRPLEAITQFGHVVGTPAYMPPEQRARRPDADQRADQFSFCATLYEALYGQRPFKVSKQELLDVGEQLTIVDKPGVEPRTLAAAPPRDVKVPAWVQRVVNRGLAVAPGHRYPSVDALLADLDRDPERTRRRVAIGATALAGAAAAAALVTWSLLPTRAATASCAGGAERIAAVWGPAPRASLARAAAALHVPWADTAVAAFADGVDHYAAAWTSMHREICEATRVHGEQSDEALDLRMACLDRHLRELDALITVMGDADVDALRQAGEAVAQLPTIDECADVEALRRVARQPPPAAMAPRIDAVEGDLARVAALYAVGNVAGASEALAPVVDEARAIGHAPTLARALYWRGRTIADRGGGADAEAAFDEVFTTALAAGDDRMAADAAARAAQEELWVGQLPGFHHWEGIARALASRTGALAVELFVDQLGCMANHWTGKPVTRLRCLRALAARRDAADLPSEWLVTTLGLAATEAGDLVDAIHWLERGVELSRNENGAEHPRTLEMRAYLCRGLDELGEHGRAVTECGDALTRLERVAPDDAGTLARLRLYLGTAELHLGHTQRARALLAAAATTPDDELRLEAEGELADLAGERGDSGAAVAQRRETLAAMIEMFGPYDPRHANIIGARHELGAALLDAGDVDGAVAELARADADVEVDEISPITLAQLRFTRARAVAAQRRPDRDLARHLAEDALAIYRRAAPDTPRFRDARAAIEAFLTALDGAAAAP